MSETMNETDRPRPDGWVPASLEEIATSFQNGCGVRRSEGGLPTVVLRLADVSIDGELAEGDTLRLVGLGEGERAKYALRPGDLLVFRVNGSRGITGRVVMYDGPEGFAYCDHFIRVRVPENVDPKFIALQCAEGPTRSAIEAGMVTTAGQNTISQGTLSKVPLLLAPFAEQKRIVAKVEELTARSRRAKEALAAVPPLLDQLRQSILAAAFRGDLTADWRAKNPNVEPAAQLLTRIRAERRARWESAELGRFNAKGATPADDHWKNRYNHPAPAEVDEGTPLPASWAWARVEELATKVVDGVHKKPNYVDEGIPFLTVKNLTAGPGISFDNVNYITSADHEEYRKRTNPERGDILITKDGTLGVTRLVNTDRVFSIFVSLALVKPALRDLGPFLELAFQSPAFQGRFVRTGSGLQHIHLGDLKNAILPVMPLAEQAELVLVVRAALQRIDALEEQHRLATESLPRLDAAFLAKAFRGELVPQDPNDEPASVLLERIRATRDLAEPRAPTPRRRASRADQPAAPAVGAVDVPVADAKPSSSSSTRLTDLDQSDVHAAAFAALWTHGPLEKDDAVRRVADHLRQAGHLDFQRLRADGPLYGQVLDAIESAVKAGHLDRPRRGHVRACKPDATAYTPEDWRHALVTSLGTDPSEREEAIRAAAEWARENLGLDFTRLRGDGHIVEALRSAINSAIRRGEVVRHDATRILRTPAASDGRTRIE